MIYPEVELFMKSVKRMNEAIKEMKRRNKWMIIL
jgi:hypothetical protein